MGVARQECQNAALCFLIVSAFFLLFGIWKDPGGGSGQTRVLEYIFFMFFRFSRFFYLFWDLEG